MEETPGELVVFIGISGGELVAVLDGDAGPGTAGIASDVTLYEVNVVFTLNDSIVGSAFDSFGLDLLCVGDVDGLNEFPNAVIIVGGVAESAFNGLTALEEIFVLVANVVFLKVGEINLELSAGELLNVIGLLGFLLEGESVPDHLLEVRGGLDGVAEGFIDALEHHADVASEVRELEEVGVLGELVSGIEPFVAFHFYSGLREHSAIERQNHENVVGGDSCGPGFGNRFSSNVGHEGALDSAAVAALTGIIASPVSNLGEGFVVTDSVSGKHSWEICDVVGDEVVTVDGLGHGVVVVTLVSSWYPCVSTLVIFSVRSIFVTKFSIETLCGLSEDTCLLTFEEIMVANFIFDEQVSA